MSQKLLNVKQSWKIIESEDDLLWEQFKHHFSRLPPDIVKTIYQLVIDMHRKPQNHLHDIHSFVALQVPYQHDFHHFWYQDYGYFLFRRMKKEKTDFWRRSVGGNKRHIVVQSRRGHPKPNVSELIYRDRDINAYKKYGYLAKQHARRMWGLMTAGERLAYVKYHKHPYSHIFTPRF